MNKSLQFSAFVPIEKAITDEKTGARLLYGPAASLKEDYDGETFQKAGIDRGLDIYMSHSRQVDYDHLYQESVKKGVPNPSLLVGVALRKEEVDGVPNLVIQLKANNDLAKSIWKEMHDDPPTPFGLSVQGTATRDPKNRKLITDTKINMVTIAPCPKGTDTWVRPGEPQGSLTSIAKALAPMMAPPGAGGSGMAPPTEPDGDEGMDDSQKAPPQEVNYGPGDGIHICANCINFDGSSGCALVAGRIRPEDTCDLFDDGEEEEEEEQPGATTAPPPMATAPPPMPMARSIRLTSGQIGIRKAVEDDEEEEDKPSAHGTCPNCGGKTYCLSCHKGSVQKAYTAGEGVVMPGTTDSTALREQEMLGCDNKAGDRKSRRRKKKKSSEEPVNKSVLLSQLRERGYTNVNALADIIERGLLSRAQGE